MKYSVKQLAKVVHEAHRTFCETIGDFSQKAWEEAPRWQQESSVEQVQFHLTHPEASMGVSHKSWMQEKLSKGWTYGPQKDEEKKTHPNLVPFDELPPETQAKDALVNSIVRALAPLVHH